MWDFLLFYDFINVVTILIFTFPLRKICWIIDKIFTERSITLILLMWMLLIDLILIVKVNHIWVSFLFSILIVCDCMLRIFWVIFLILWYLVCIFVFMSLFYKILCVCSLWEHKTFFWSRFFYHSWRITCIWIAIKLLMLDDIRLHKSMVT